MMRRISLLSFVVLAATGCIPKKPYSTLGNATWNPALDGDLKVAASSLSRAMADQGYGDVHVIWAGARNGEYTIFRGPTGEPVNKFAQVAFGYKLPDGKCYLDNNFSTLQSGPLLVRENQGAASYGEPKITGFVPPRSAHEIVCDALINATSGVKEPF